LDRIARNDLAGFTATHVLSEAAHRLMTLEAIALQNWPQTGIALRMRNHPAVVQSLTRFRPSIESIQNRGVQVVVVDPSHVVHALAVSQQTGLLHNDALVVVVMQHSRLTNIASVDTDFDRVPGITRYSP
jgi:predicted nucleic acid-binding protein